MTRPATRSTTAAAKQTERSWTAEELAKHNVPSDLYIAIRGKVYDITDFAKRHPGGMDVLRIAAGRDATNVFEMYHRLSLHAMVRTLPCMGTLDHAELPTFPEPNAFFRTVKQRVEDHFVKTKRDPKVAPWMWVRYALIYMTIIGSYLVQTFVLGDDQFAGRLALALPLGFALALLGLMPMHDASHFAVSSSPWVWRALGATHDFLNGASYYVWLQQHMLGHHPYTNIHGADPDVDTNEADVRRIKHVQNWFPFYLHQHVYVPLLYALLGLKTRLQDITIVYVLRRNGAIRVNPPSLWHHTVFISGKLFWLFWRIIVPFALMPWWQALAVFALQDMVSSYWLALTFQANHVVRDVDWPAMPDTPDRRIDLDWATMQMRTTQDYAHSSWFWNVFSGALNHQVTHHIFPGVSQYYYPEVSPIVAATAREFNVPYHYKETYAGALGSHLGHLYDLGRKPSAD